MTTIRMTSEEIRSEPRYQELSRIICSGPANNSRVDRWAENWVNDQLDTEEIDRLRESANSESFDRYVRELRRLGRKIARAKKTYNDHPDKIMDLVIGLYEQRNCVIRAKRSAESSRRVSSPRQRPAPRPATQPSASPAPQKSNTLSTLMPWVAVILGLYWWLGGNSDKKGKEVVQRSPAQTALQQRLSALDGQIAEKQRYVVLSAQDKQIAANVRGRKDQENREFSDKWSVIEDGTESIADTVGNFADAAENLGRLFDNAHNAGRSFRGKKR